MSRNIKLILIFTIIVIFLYGIFQFTDKLFHKTKLQTHLENKNILTFLIVGLDSEEKVSFSSFIFLEPTQKKVGFFVINPITVFEKEDGPIEFMGEKTINYLIPYMEKITNLNVNYSFLVKEKDFIRFLNIIGGIQFFFDPSIFVSDDIYKRNSGDYKLYGKEIIDFLRLPEKPEPMDYLNRLNRQESIILSIYDRIKELTEFRKEWITHFENKITTELIGEELYSLFDFINKEKIVFSIKELPVEPFTPEKSEREFLLAKQDSGKITFQKLKKFLEAEDYKYGELVRSEILNSTDKNGLAKSVKSILNEKRIKVLTVGNGWNSNEKFSVVIDRSGNSEFSYKIANILGIKKVRHIIDKELGLDTTVLLGEDFEIKPRK